MSISQREGSASMWSMLLVLLLVIFVVLVMIVVSAAVLASRYDEDQEELMQRNVPNSPTDENLYNDSAIEDDE